MKKIFDPKITQGPWMISGDSRIAFCNLQDIGTIICSERTALSVSQRVLLSMNTHFNFKEDLKAISAVPEMLEVIKSINHWYSISYKEIEKKELALKGIERAFTMLLEKHGDDCINEQ